MSEPVQTPQTQFQPRIFSGIQPSGGLTLGNYLGALKRFAALQGDQAETIYCLVDLHAITVWQEPEKLRRNIREAAAAFMASGVDPRQSILFNQSQVSAHAEMAWLFNTVARVGWMYRMTQFKDKAGKNSENASLGLLAYPALMAADILTYQATGVPVGEDQKQHLELTRDIAQKFNADFGVALFPLPEPLIIGPATRVMSLRDGKMKMSKSDPSEYSRINMTDDADAIRRKIQKATSDPGLLPASPVGLEGRPEAANLLGIYAALADETLEAACARFTGAMFSTFKRELADLAVSRLEPITAEMRRLEADPGHLDKILAMGAERARAIAAPVLNEVFEVVGFLRCHSEP